MTVAAKVLASVGKKDIAIAAKKVALIAGVKKVRGRPNLIRPS